MRTSIFYQGYNRIENRHIIQIERAKLNRLLTDESRLIESLARGFKHCFSSATHCPGEVNPVWDKIQNHVLVQSIRHRINLLADAYPQFLSQIKRAGEELKIRIMRMLENMEQTT